MATFGRSVTKRLAKEERVRRSKKNFPRARPLEERDIFLITFLKYATGTLPLSQKEVIKQLQGMLLYRNYSEKQLRRLLERALSNPQDNRFLKIKLTPPVDQEMGRMIQSLLQGVREVIVIPSVNHFDVKAASKFLGLAAANVFGPRLIGGQAIGLGSGEAIDAFASCLDLEPSIANHLKFFALINSEAGIETLMKVVARYNADAVVAAEKLKPDDLDWIFVEFEPLVGEPLSRGFVARILNYLLTKEGGLIASNDVSSVSPLLLQQMVQRGKGVVAVARGAEGAEAIVAEYQLRRIGRALFNFLVTDESCALEILRYFNRKSIDIPHRHSWYIKQHAFLACFLRYTMNQTNKDVARSLHLSVKQVKRLLKAAAQGDGETGSILSFKVYAPSTEMALEASLLKSWSLMEVRVVPTSERIEEGLKLVGKAGADLLTSLLRYREEFTVGFGSGSSIKAIFEALNFEKLFRDFPLLRQLRICALEPNPIPKVLGVVSETILTSLLTSIERKDKVTLCRYDASTGEPQLDAVFLSIGSLNYPDTLQALIQDDGLIAMRDEVEGMILFQFITRDKKILPTRWARRMNIMPLAKIREMVEKEKPVVIAAYGLHKADAIIAAYNMKLFNCLIVDRSLAEILLARSSGKSLMAGKFVVSPQTLSITTNRGTS